MGTMNNGTSWNDAVTINKQSGTKITLDTDGKFVAKDIELTINVQGGSATTPDTTITANPTLSINSSTGVVTGTVSTTKSVTPTVSAGYISTGSAGTMTVSGSNTLSLSTQAAQTITPGTTSQTIAAGKYLTGAQTIAGDSNLVAENIAEGVSIFGVTGTHSGGGGASANAVNFRDYDGTIVQSYSAEDFAALTAMPNNPSHDGLTAQGWNWTLAKAKTYVAKYGRLEIGQMYITDDGKTRVYIHLEQGRTSPMLGCCPNGTVDVDWGDGTAHDTLTGTSTSTVKWTSNHTYAAPGDYVIKLTVTGSMGFYGSNSGNQYSGLLRYTSSGDSRNYVYRSAIQRVEIGSSVTSIAYYAFYNCYGLASVTIPDGVTSIGGYAFQGCYGVAEYHLAPTTPPKLSNANAFTGISADCIIYVPYSADHSILEAYKTASNWSNYASYMQEEPQ